MATAKGRRVTAWGRGPLPVGTGPLQGKGEQMPRGKAAARRRSSIIGRKATARGNGQLQ
jgi:hypothetical protein